ncbi:hypothetical protein CFD26_106781 [Aspergillus turcosus]|uniref:Uncharacterized protein n=1 Tax=Aspergillus turcosus TaxID=1245748 RepID=A0A421D510_9EURO|nr:hypothetical protein CFD26_106781 [Aspergillus turcosus]
MCLQDGALPLWHILSALLCMSISVLFQPAGHVSFVDDLKVNTAFLSPITGALWSLRTVFGVLGCRVSNLADLPGALWIASQKEFQSHDGPFVMSALGRGPRNIYFIARWVFFVLVTFPLYLSLVLSVQVWWGTTWATFLIAKFLLLELPTRYYDPPRTRIPSKSDQSHLHKKEAVAEQRIDPKEAEELLPLCTRIEKFRSVMTSSLNKAEQSRMTPAKDFYLRKALNHESTDFQLRCTHTRCLLFKLFHALTVLYLGHQNLRTITILATGWMMKPRWVMVSDDGLSRVRVGATEVTFCRRFLEVTCLSALAVACVVYFFAFGYPPVSPFAFAWVGEAFAVMVILVAGFKISRWLVKGPRAVSWSTGEDWRTIDHEERLVEDPPLLEHLFVFAWTVVFVIPAVVVWVVMKTVFCAAIASQEAEIQKRFDEYYEHPGF